MPRPQKERRIGHCAPATYFKPQGIPMRLLETVELSADELEAVRLTDFEELYQEQAAEQMGVSRQTLGLILKRAHKKIAEALTQGKAIFVETAPDLSHLRRCDEPGSPPPGGRRCGQGRGRRHRGGC